MYDELMDDFLPWFLFMTDNEANCPYCGGILAKKELKAYYHSKGNYATCPYCKKKITKENLA